MTPSPAQCHRYGPASDQFAELRVPEGPSRGVVIVIHGGYWRAEYDSTLGTPLAVDLTSRGWTTWNLEYRRTGSGGLLAALQDVRAGIGALEGLRRSGGCGVGGDVWTAILLGHSAGGFLACWAATRAGAVGPTGEPALSAVISQAGVVDIAAAAADDLDDGSVRRFLGDYWPARMGPGADPWGVDLLRNPPLSAPVYCLHGEDDVTVPQAYSERLVTAIRQAGGRAELVRTTGGHHAHRDPGSAAWESTCRVIDSVGGRGSRARSSLVGACVLHARGATDEAIDVPHEAGT